MSLFTPNRIAVAIDPGYQGGIAFQYDDSNPELINMPETASDIRKVFIDKLGSCKNVVVGIERQHARPVYTKETSHEYQSGRLALEKVMNHPSLIKDLGLETAANLKKAQDKYNQMIIPARGAASQWSQAEHYGILLGILVGLPVKYEIILPKEWQSIYYIKKTRGELQNAWKNRLKKVAQEVYPQSTITLKTADAALILNYLILKHWI